MKLNEYIKLYGFPEKCTSINEFIEKIKKFKEESLKLPSDNYIEWAYLKFFQGKAYVYNSSSRLYEELEE
jgi:hypothetical protein